MWGFVLLKNFFTFFFVYTLKKKFFAATAQAQAFAINTPFGVFSFAGSSALAG
jgi:hypothetical protein